MTKDEERIPLKTILTNFLNRVNSMTEDAYEKEFKSLKDFSESLKYKFLCSQGEKDVNRKKNRYKDILPFDYTRVVLSEYLEIPGSDYINANYIKGASGSKAYIASQGPLPHTVHDFWRMVVETEVQVIVMACNEQEAGKHKCERYWTQDSDDDERFGNYRVKLIKSRVICPDFLVRTLKLEWTNLEAKEEERTVCQFHYSAWPDHGIPLEVKPLLEMVRLIRDCQASETLPVLIHCSAGCGRTGTICAIDFIWGLLRTGKLTSDLSLFELIKEMRRQRIAIVQTVDQYILVHHAVKELFLEQLSVIDSHPYENVDDDGRPLAQESEEITPDYETVFVNDSVSIDDILSLKIRQQQESKESSLKRLESLNLESRYVRCGSASATASTANSSDNLLDDIHRDISKSTPKLFDPPDSSTGGRIKRGNLRLYKTDEGHWKLVSKDENSLRRRPFQSGEDSGLTKLPKFEVQVSGSSQSVPSSLDRKKNIRSGDSRLSESKKPTAVESIKRSKSMKVIPRRITEPNYVNISYSSILEGNGQFEKTKKFSFDEITPPLFHRRERRNSFRQAVDNAESRKTNYESIWKASDFECKNSSSSYEPVHFKDYSRPLNSVSLVMNTLRNAAPPPYKCPPPISPTTTKRSNDSSSRLPRTPPELPKKENSKLHRRHSRDFVSKSVSMSPPGVDLDAVAALMETQSKEPIKTPVLSRTLAGVFSGAAANLRSLLGSSTSNLLPESSNNSRHISHPYNFRHDVRGSSEQTGGSSSRKQEYL